MSRAEIGEQRRARMRERLLAASARVIAERGPEKVTIDDFIAAAEVSRGTFYNHFSTREALLEALWTSIGHDPFAELLIACKTISDPVEHLSTVTRLVLRQAASNPSWGWLVVALSAERAMRDYLKGKYGDLVNRIETSKDLSADDEKALHEAIKDFKKNGSY